MNKIYKHHSLIDCSILLFQVIFYQINIIINLIYLHYEIDEDDRYSNNRD